MTFPRPPLAGFLASFMVVTMMPSIATAPNSLRAGTYTKSLETYSISLVFTCQANTSASIGMT